MMCAGCVETKDKALTYEKCNKCAGYRPLTPSEISKISNRKTPCLK